MAIEDLTLLQKPGKTVYYVIWDLGDDTVFDSADDTFKTLVSAASPALPAAPEPTFPGVRRTTYNHRIDLARVHNGKLKNFYVAAYFQAGASPAPTTDEEAGDLNLSIEQGKLRVTIEDVQTAVGDVSGVGDVQVDEDYGGANRLCYAIDGVPVDNAEITFYLASDFLAGNTAEKFIIAASRTSVDGSWERPVMLDPGDYVLRFHKQHEAGPDVFLLKVTVDPADSTVTPIPA